ncbi:hypothetical protein CDAR_224591 [Caerostris darwini]|uniref:Uncharacterized protein n=1 Tax=Caerostris darwini TaxID=1538125 RepID=A0AAV4QXG3_9ARAC|nr:hypothetical protein CDAR_224591 [Caerostris darwini]
MIFFCAQETLVVYILQSTVNIKGVHDEKPEKGGRLGPNEFQLEKGSCFAIEAVFNEGKDISRNPTRHSHYHCGRLINKRAIIDKFSVVENKSFPNHLKPLEEHETIINRRKML